MILIRKWVFYVLFMVVETTTHVTKTKKFYRIPKIIKNNDPSKRDEKLSTARRKKWFLNISRADLDEDKAEHTRVCSDHFISGQPAKLYDQSSPDWAPTQRTGHNKIKLQISLQISRSERSQERTAKKAKLEAAKLLEDVEKSVQATFVASNSPADLQSDLIEISLDNQNSQTYEVGCQTDPTVGKADVECQTDFTVLRLNEMEDCIRSMICELTELKKKLMEADFREESFQNSDEKTKFYTGIPNFLIFQHVLSLCCPYIYSGATNSLTKFQELLLTLMRVRLNVSLQDIAYRFNISQSTASRIFDKWIDVMDVRLAFLIVWPSREELIETMPACFKENYGSRVAVIIDCFEVFINRPSSLIAQAITWSNYKHHNTVKFLIGITPQGVISFISQAWGGRASDKHVTDNCGILENLIPGDLVLADRGFNIAESVGLYQASLKIPAFTRGKKQLSAQEIEHMRKIANVRIHVERVIGLVRRKYVILQSILPVELVTVKAGQLKAPIDKIARVCCALTNLSESVVPFN